MCVSVPAKIHRVAKNKKRGPVQDLFFCGSLHRFDSGQLGVDAVPRDKVQRDAVDAIAQSSGRRAVFKDVAKVPATRVAHDFHAAHAVAQIHALFHACGGRGLVEAGPSAVAFEFGPRVKQLGAAPHADVHAVFVVKPKFTGEPRLSALLPQDAVGVRTQDATPAGRFQAVRRQI